MTLSDLWALKAIFRQKIDDINEAMYVTINEDSALKLAASRDPYYDAIESIDRKIKEIVNKEFPGVML